MTKHSNPSFRMSPTFFWGIVHVIRLVFWPFVRPRIEGQENFPKGPFVGVFNHSSSIDAMIMPSVITSVTCYWAKAEISKWPVIGWLFSHAGAVYIHRGRGDQQAFTDAIERLDAGYAFFLAPEGTRHHNSDGKAKVKTGFVRLAQMAGCPVVPVAISGAREALPPGKFFPRSTCLRVKVGEPLHLEPIEASLENSEALAQQAKDVMRRVYEMKNELDARCS